MPIVYMDCVFVFNTAADYFLFLIAARLAGIPLRRKRYVLAALLGGAYAAAVFLPGGEVLTTPLLKISVGVLLAVVAYGNERQLFRLTILWILVSCVFAGSVLGLSLLLGEIPGARGIFYTHINTKILAAAFAAGYFLIAVMFRSAARPGIEGNLVSARIWMQGKSVAFSVLRDTGNALCDLFSGKPVLIVAPGVLHPILPSGISRCITPERLQKPIDLLEDVCRSEPELCPQLLPYRSVGKQQGFLLSIQVDKAEIGGDSYPGLRVALSPTKLGNGYSALWGGPVGEGVKYASISKTEKLVMPMGASWRNRRRPLYRGK